MHLSLIICNDNAKIGNEIPIGFTLKEMLVLILKSLPIDKVFIVILCMHATVNKLLLLALVKL